jgi:Tfp pilus assembly protein FimT
MELFSYIILNVRVTALPQLHGNTFTALEHNYSSSGLIVLRTVHTNPPDSQAFYPSQYTVQGAEAAFHLHTTCQQQSSTWTVARNSRGYARLGGNAGYECRSYAGNDKNGDEYLAQQIHVE